MERFAEPKDAIVVTLQDVVMLTRLREKIAKPDSQQDKAFCNDIRRMVEAMWARSGTAAMTQLKSLPSAIPLRNILANLGFPAGVRTANRKGLNDSSKGRKRMTVADSAGQDDLLQQIANTCVDIATASGAFAKRVRRDEAVGGSHTERGERVDEAQGGGETAEA